jgi:hypothetical protein
MGVVAPRAGPEKRDDGAIDFTCAPRSWPRAHRVLVARKLRDAGMPVAEIARRMHLSARTVHEYVADPDGAMRHQRAQRRRGSCEHCGASTWAADARCACCAAEHRARWDWESVLAAWDAWRERHGDAPTSTDWNATKAARRGGAALERFNARSWPPMSTVRRLFGRWAHLAAEAARRP